MIQNTQEFRAEVFGARFKENCKEFQKLLTQGKLQELTDISKKLDEELKIYREQGLLGVAFVGAYNAGKSTQITALTGRRDIKIGSDVTTDTTTKYDWNGIKLIDTPGLWADRKDHDEITYDAIKKADLLIFCLTYDLFDDITVENFKNLAYEQRYQWKILLVINKMSDEAGEETEKIANYRESLAHSLKPNNINEFPICFIDAKQYCEGVDNKNKNLIEASRFQTFIEKLNTFVNKRGDKARFDTPVRIAQGCVDEAQLSFIKTINSTQDEAFLELFNRLSRVVEKERECLRNSVNDIKLKNSEEILKQITNLSSAIGEDNFRSEQTIVMSTVNKCYETAERQIQQEFNKTIDSLKQEFETIFKSNLSIALQESLLSKKTLERLSITPIKPKNEQLEDIKTIIVGNVQLIGFIFKDASLNEETKNAIKAANEDIKKAQMSFFEAQRTGDVANINNAEKSLNEVMQNNNELNSPFINENQVAGSWLHHQFINFDNNILGNRFTPGQEIEIAKNIANAATFISYTLAVVGVAAEAWSIVQEQERQKKIEQVRQKIITQLTANSEDLKGQLEKRLSDFEEIFLKDIKQKIDELKKLKQKEIINSHTWLKQLSKIRQEFEDILSSVQTL
ncbi:GTPase [Dolichospermum circinale]|uniref:GTPase n=1 Tax=Dolichospermum circinale TaxID=109265 RepID=UPI00232FFE38|nr:GTPase [Dolichospermum circinale]MDB9452024.1 50S ribosome-binding GTPase [Dolichospermum circinale CS-547]